MRHTHVCMMAVGSDASSPSSNNITFESELFSKRRHQGENKHPAQAVYRTYHRALNQHCCTLKATIILSAVVALLAPMAYCRYVVSI